MVAGIGIHSGVVELKQKRRVARASVPVIMNHMIKSDHLSAPCQIVLARYNSAPLYLHQQPINIIDILWLVIRQSTCDLAVNIVYCRSGIGERANYLKEHFLEKERKF
jgi:hypothetical protein